MEIKLIATEDRGRFFLHNNALLILITGLDISLKINDELDNRFCAESGISEIAIPERAQYNNGIISSLVQKTCGSNPVW